MCLKSIGSRRTVSLRLSVVELMADAQLIKEDVALVNFSVQEDIGPESLAVELTAVDSIVAHFVHVRIVYRPGAENVAKEKSDLHPHWSQHRLPVGNILESKAYSLAVFDSPKMND
jgi:hypothetical protein